MCGRRFRRVIGETAPPRTRAVNEMGRIVGDELMTRYVIAFEVAGLLLTVALVGAIAIAHREEAEPAAARSGGRPLANRPQAIPAEQVQWKSHPRARPIESGAFCRPKRQRTVLRDLASHESEIGELP